MTAVVVRVARSTLFILGGLPKKCCDALLITDIATSSNANVLPHDNDSMINDFIFFIIC